MLTCLVFTVIWLLAALTMAFVLRTEQEEMLNLSLCQTAELFRPVPVDRWAAGDARPLGADRGDPDEALVCMLLDRDDEILLRSASAEEADLPPGPPSPGQQQTAANSFYTTMPDAGGLFARFGYPTLERREGLSRQSAGVPAAAPATAGASLPRRRMARAGGAAPA